MTTIEDQIIHNIKLYINSGDLETVKVLYDEYVNETEFEREIAWDYVFQKIYLHAELKKQKAICEWLDTLFATFDPIQQIAMRQMFPYARHLLEK